MFKNPLTNGEDKDEIQRIISQMAADMPEVKEQLDTLDLTLPPALQRAPVPPRSWLDKIGDWAIRPSLQVPPVLSTAGLPSAILLCPILLGGLLTAVSILFSYMEGGGF